MIAGLSYVDRAAFCMGQRIYNSNAGNRVALAAALVKPRP